MGCRKLHRAEERYQHLRVIRESDAIKANVVQMWLRVDPLADKYPSHSPYNYTLNNPIMLIDPNGMSVDGWEVNIETNEATRVSDEGGANEQHITYVTPGGEVAPRGKDVIKGDGFSIENGKATSQRSDGSPFHSYYSRSANKPHLNQTIGKTYDPESMISFEASFETGFAGGLNLKVLGEGFKFKLGLSKTQRETTFTEDGIESIYGGDMILSSHFGISHFSIGGEQNMRTRNVNFNANFGPAKISGFDFRYELFDLGFTLGVGLNIKLSVSPNFLTGDTRRP